MSSEAHEMLRVYQSFLQSARHVGPPNISFLKIFLCGDNSKVRLAMKSANKWVAQWNNVIYVQLCSGLVRYLLGALINLFNLAQICPFRCCRKFLCSTLGGCRLFLSGVLLGVIEKVLAQPFTICLPILRLIRLYLIGVLCRVLFAISL